MGVWLDDVEILRVIAAGGFGIVYHARDHSLQRDVAVKEFMPLQLVTRRERTEVALRSAEVNDVFSQGLQSFINEAQLLAGLNHPAMVGVHRLVHKHGTAYMVMPYVRGPGLHQVRRSMSGPPSEAWLRSVLMPLLDALSMLHALGVYHRDVSPDNVLLPSPGAPVLLDFGAARRVLGNRTRSLTAVLKPSYAPVEQYNEGSHLRQGPWTDLYALAATVAYLIDGVPPPASVTRCIDDTMPVYAQRQIPGVSRRFLAAIDWALSVHPRDRPQNASQLRAAIEGRIVTPSSTRQSFGPRAPGAGHQDGRPGASLPGAASSDVPNDVDDGLRTIVLDELPASDVVPTHPSKPAHAATVRDKDTADRQQANAPYVRAVHHRLPVAWLALPAVALLAAAAWHQIQPADPLLAQPATAQALQTLPAVKPVNGGSSQPSPVPSPLAPSTVAILSPALVTELPSEPAPLASPASGKTEPAQPLRAAVPPLAPHVGPHTQAPAAHAPHQPARATEAPPRASAGSAQRARNIDTVRPARAAKVNPTKTQRQVKVSVPDPRQACSDRQFFFAQQMCIQRRCSEPRYSRHEQCEELRQTQEALSKREYGA